MKYGYFFVIIAFIKRLPQSKRLKAGGVRLKERKYMESYELDPEAFEIVKIERKEGIFTNSETGTQIPFKSYYVHIKNKDNPLVMRAKIDKVFNDYVEYTD